MEGIDFLTTIAAKGDREIQYRTGKLYLNGIAAPKDREVAIQWFEKSANQGYAPAQYELGRLYSHCNHYKTYHKNKNVSQEQKDKDNEIAGQWFLKASRQDFPDAFAGLFDLEYKSLFQYDLRDWNSCFSGWKMFRWASKGAENKSKQSEINLGICYHLGIGVAKKMLEAITCFERLASSEDKYCALYLAILFADGNDVPKEPGKAKLWFQRALELGYDVENDKTNNCLIQMLLLCYEHTFDKSGFIKFAFPVCHYFFDAKKIDRELSALFVPYLDWAKSKEIVIQDVERDKEVAYLPKTAVAIYNDLKEIQQMLPVICNNYQLMMPYCQDITIEDFFPFCKNETVKRIKREVVNAWFFIKKNFKKETENLSFLDDSEILDYAEIAGDSAITMILISIIEIKLDLEYLTNSFVEVYNDLMHLKENPEDSSIIKKMAELFMKGSRTISRSYILAKEWYAKIPDDPDAKRNLAIIDEYLI